MDPLDRHSFATLSSITFPTSQTLAQNAINPYIDIVALYRSAPRPPKPALAVSAILAARREKMKTDATKKEIEDGGWRLKDEDGEQDLEVREEKELDRVVVGVWRLNSKDGDGKDALVWERELSGNKMSGLIWSADGSALSVILDVSLSDPSSSMDDPITTYKLYHLSVHNGCTLHSQHLHPTKPFPTRAPPHATHPKSLPLSPQWLLNPCPYPKPNPSSSLAIIGSIAMPNPVRSWSSAAQLKSLGTQNFQINPNGAGSATGGATLTDKKVERLVRRVCGDLPVVLGDATGDTALEDVGGPIGGRMDPHVLNIPELGISLLGGTFVLPSDNMRDPSFTTASVPLTPSSTSTKSTTTGPTPSTTTDSTLGFDKTLLPPSIPQERTMRLMEAGDRIRRYLKVVVEGLEMSGRIWKDGIESEHKGWLDKLEECATDNGSDLLGARADLTRLLLAGRSGDAISQFIGGSLTNNGIERWSSLYDASMVEMRRVLSTTVFPSCERLLVILEEFSGWLMYGKQVTGSDGSALAALRDSMNWVTHLATKVMELDRVAEEECKRFREFIKFMKYEIARNTMTQGEEEAEVPSSHDVLLVCDYLDTVFLDSQIGKYLWTLEQIEAIDYDQPVLPVRRSERKVKTVLAEGLGNLRNAMTNPSTKVSKSATDGGSAPAMLSPMLNRGRGMSEESEGAENMEFDDNPWDRHAGNPRRVSEATNSDMSTDGEKPDRAVRRVVDMSKPLWPMAAMVATGLSHILKPDGPLNWEDRRPGGEHLANVQDVLRSSLALAGDGHGYTEVYQDADTRHIAWLSQSDPPDLRTCSLKRTKASPTSRANCLLRSYATHSGTNMLGTSFFDSRELLVLLHGSSTGLVYLASVDHQHGEVFEDRELVERGDLFHVLAQNPIEAPEALQIDRSRCLGFKVPDKSKPEDQIAIAANGREGRRIACVLGDHGMHLEVYDIDIDEASAADESMGMEMD